MSGEAGFGAPVVALTFDDGPSEWTEPILDDLAAHGGHATFFVVGEAITGEERAATIRRLAAEGHEIANHTFTHPDVTTLSEAALREELRRTTALIEETAGVTPVRWRAPFLRSDETALAVGASLGLEHVGCSSMPGDWELTAEETFRRVRDRLVPGDVVVLHDGRPTDEPPELSHATREQTVLAVGLLLDHMSERGLRCVTVAELRRDDFSPQP